MSKYVLLDVDGVLNSTGSALAKIGKNIGEAWSFIIQNSVRSVDPVAVALTNRLLDKTGALLVLTTSHRTCETHYTYFRSPLHLSRLSVYMYMLGIKHPVHDITPVSNKMRGYDVLEWKDGLDDEDPEYVIIDDSNDFLPLQPLIRCSADYGFTAKEYYQAARALGAKESEIIY